MLSQYIIEELGRKSVNIKHWVRQAGDQSAIYIKYL